MTSKWILESGPKLQFENFHEGSIPQCRLKLWRFWVEKPGISLANESWNAAWTVCMYIGQFWRRSLLLKIALTAAGKAQNSANGTRKLLCQDASAVTDSYRKTWLMTLISAFWGLKMACEIQWTRNSSARNHVVVFPVCGLKWFLGLCWLFTAQSQVANWFQLRFPVEQDWSGFTFATFAPYETSTVGTWFGALKVAAQALQPCGSHGLKFSRYSLCCAKKWSCESYRVI